MRRATITLDDELEERLDRYLDSLEAPPSLASLVQAALRRYLDRVAGEGPRSKPADRKIAETEAEYDTGEGRLALDSETALRLCQAASEEGLDADDLIRSVLQEYLRNRGRPRPVGIGRYHSGHSDVGSRAEEILRRAARSSRSSG